jgi:uncharacterized protein YkwD
MARSPDLNPQLALVAWVLLALGLAGCAATGGRSPSARSVRTDPPAARAVLARSPPAQPGHAEIRALVTVVNRRRKARGCDPLVWDERLARVAARHSEAMARQDFFSHVDRHGKDPFDRMRDAGIGFRAAAENIAFGQTSAAEVFDGWVKSRGHRDNLDRCDYTHHGIGLYRNRWTHVFAKF